MADEQKSSTKGTVRKFPIPSCSISVGDLLKLYNLLGEKSEEAAEREITKLQRSDKQPDDEFNKLKENARSLLKLGVAIQAANGEIVIGETPEVLKAETLPDSVERVVYESALLFRGRFEKPPDNSFTVTLDFRRTSVLDLTNISGTPTPNESAAIISGSDTTWVNGVYEEMHNFFQKRASRSGWLHSHYIYDLLLILLGFPMSFAWVIQVNKWLEGATFRMPSALLVAIYVYIVIIFLYAFRILFNYARWVFPRIEGPQREGKGPWKHKAFLSGLSLSLFSTLIRELFKITFSVFTDY